MAFAFRPDFVVQYLTARLSLFMAQAFPLESALRWGERAGRMGNWFVPSRSKIAVDNLLRAYPDMSEAEARRITLRVFEHFGRASVESAVAHRLLRLSTFRNHVVVRNEDRLRKVISDGRGAIFVTAHVGVWEIFGLVLHFMGETFHAVYRPIKNPLIDRLMRKRRLMFDQVLVPRAGAVRKLLRVLRNKGYIGLVADQHAKLDGVWVPFFNRLASTTAAPALLALRTGAPIICGYARRLPGVYRFEVFFDEPINAVSTGDRAADVEQITREISRRMEGYIRQFPEQWLWLHRRWHKTPQEREAERGNDV